MAIINDGILGPFNNKVGTVVGRKFRGLDIMTGLYTKKTNEPPSVDRLMQQTRFGLLNSFLSNISTLVDPGFRKEVKKGQSPINAAFSYNFAHAFIEPEPVVDKVPVLIQEEDAETPKSNAGIEQDSFGIVLNFPELVYSRGPVERPNCASVELVAPDTIKFTWWPQQENVNSRYNDLASFLIYGATSDHRIKLPRAAQRSDLQYEIQLPEGYLGDTFHCYMSFNDAVGKRVGMSEYIGVVETGG